MSAHLPLQVLDVVPHDRKPFFQAVGPLDELVVLLDLLREGVKLELGYGPALRVGEDHADEGDHPRYARDDD